MNAKASKSNSRKRMLFAFAPLVSVLMVVSACSGAPQDQSAEPQSQAVTIGVDGNMLGVQPWVAQDQGFFDEQDIDAQMSIFQTGADAVRAVAGKQVDLAIALDFAVTSSLSDGLRILGSVASPGPGYYHLMVQEGITGPQDLKGKTIGYNAGASGEYTTRQYLTVNGINEDAVNLVALPAEADLVTGLKTHEIDASWISPAGRTALKDDSFIVDLTDDAVVVTGTGIYLVGRTDWVSEHEDAVERVWKAFGQATDYANANPDLAGDIVAKAVNGDAKQITATIPRQGYGVGFGAPNLDRLKTVQAFLVKAGKITADNDTSHYLDLTGLKAAYPDSVTSD
jgi:NitT/TauT family transport system substrate-binding protein